MFWKKHSEKSAILLYGWRSNGITITVFIMALFSNYITNHQMASKRWLLERLLQI